MSVGLHTHTSTHIYISIYTLMMSLLRPRDVTKESWSSLCVTCTVGLRPFEVYKIKFFGYLYIIILLISYYVLFYYSMSYSDKIFSELETISKAIKLRRIQMILNIFILPFMIISSVFTYDKVKTALLDIRNLDKQLKMFNVELNYNKYMREDVVNIFGIIILTILMGLTDYYSLKLAGNTYMYDLTWITIQFPQIVNSVAISTFVVMIAKTSRRHAMINNLIMELKYVEKKEVGTHVSAEIDSVFRLKLLREMYEICNNITATINDAYGMTLLVSLSLCSIAICAHLKVVYSSFGVQTDAVDFLVDSMWTCFYFGKIVYIVDACHTIEFEGKRASRLLHECRVDASHHLLKQENESFARQVSNRDIRIMACDFFAIDYSLLAKVVLAMTTYVFFLSQFSCAK